ncbi:MAG: metallophosphoesterase [Aquificaceae bacterium]
MRWFIPIFLSLFALMHVYVYLHLVKAFNSIVIRFIGIMTFLIGFLSPFLWRYADANWNPQIAYYIAFGGLLWMGFLLYFLVNLLIFDLYKAFVFLSKRLFGLNPLPIPSRKGSLLTALFFSIALSSYSHYETLNLRVERFTLYTDKLPESIDHIKILHLSDLHLGPVMGMDKIRPILSIYEREKPHIVISTGDLIDGNMRDKRHLAIALGQMNPPLGKYAVFGNHEYYRGVDQAVEFTQEVGFKLLRGDTFLLKDYNISLVGIDDDDCRFFRVCKGTLSDVELLKGAKRDSFVIYLKHKPRLERGAEELFDLMLSGHTHGGVYYPVGRLILTKIFISDRGLHRIGDAHLYISKGVGTGGPPMRLFSPPDVAILEIVNKPK